MLWQHCFWHFHANKAFWIELNWIDTTCITQQILPYLLNNIIQQQLITAPLFTLTVGQVILVSKCFCKAVDLISLYCLLKTMYSRKEMCKQSWKATVTQAIKSKNNIHQRNFGTNKASYFVLLMLWCWHWNLAFSFDILTYIINRPCFLSLLPTDKS